MAFSVTPSVAGATFIPIVPRFPQPAYRHRPIAKGERRLDQGQPADDTHVASKSISAPVAIVMGSRSDWPTLQCAAEALDALEVAWIAKVVSAHRTPDRMVAFAKGAKRAGHKVIIAGPAGPPICPAWWRR